MRILWGAVSCFNRQNAGKRNVPALRKAIASLDLEELDDWDPPAVQVMVPAAAASKRGGPPQENKKNSKKAKREPSPNIFFTTSQGPSSFAEVFSRSIVSSSAKRKAVSACTDNIGLSTLKKAADGSAVAVVAEKPLFVSSAPPPPVRSASVVANRKIQRWSKESLDSSQQEATSGIKEKPQKRRMTTKLQFVNDKTVPRIVRLENYKPTSSSFGGNLQVYIIKKNTYRSYGGQTFEMSLRFFKSKISAKN